MDLTHLVVKLKDDNLFFVIRPPITWQLECAYHKLEGKRTALFERIEWRDLKFRVWLADRRKGKWNV